MTVYLDVQYIVYPNGQATLKRKSYFALDERGVLADLTNQGAQPLSIRRKRIRWYQRQYISADYKQSFLRALAFLCETGETPGAALEALINRESDTAYRAEFQPAHEVLQRGSQSFMEAMKRLDMYSNGVLAIIEAGEKAKDLRTAVQTAIKFMTDRAKLWRMSLSAAAWVAFDLFTALSTVIGIQYQLLPMISDSINSVDNAQARLSLLDSIARAYIINGTLMWVSIVATAGVAFVALSQFFRTGKWLKQFSGYAERMPVVRQYLENGALYSTFSIVAQMTAAGMPFNDTLRIAISSSSVRSVKEFWTQVEERLLNGSTSAEAMMSKLLTVAERLVIGAHKDFDQLQVIAATIATTRQEATDRALKRIITWAMILTVGYSTLAAVNALWVVWLQSQGLNVTLDSIK